MEEQTNEEEYYNVEKYRDPRDDGISLIPPTEEEQKQIDRKKQEDIRELRTRQNLEKGWKPYRSPEEIQAAKKEAEESKIRNEKKRQELAEMGVVTKKEGKPVQNVELWERHNDPQSPHKHMVNYSPKGEVGFSYQKKQAKFREQLINSWTDEEMKALSDVLKEAALVKKEEWAIKEALNRITGRVPDKIEVDSNGSIGWSFEISITPPQAAPQPLEVIDVTPRSLTETTNNDITEQDKTNTPTETA